MRTHHIFLFSMFLLFSFITVSCSVDTVPSSKVPRAKLLRYYHAMCTNHATTYVKAYFYSDAHLDTMNNPYGTAVELDQPASVSFNGAPLKFKKGWWSGVFYGAESETWPGTFRFEWTDNTGRKYIDVAAMDTIRPASDWLINTGGGYAVAWEGSPVRPGETVSVTLGDRKKSNLHFSTGTVGARYVPVHGLPFGFTARLYQRIEITRTLARRYGAIDFMDEIEDGVYFKLIYSARK